MAAPPAEHVCVWCVRRSGGCAGCGREPVRGFAAAQRSALRRARRGARRRPHAAQRRARRSRSAPPAARPGAGARAFFLRGGARGADKRGHPPSFLPLRETLVCNRGDHLPRALPLSRCCCWRSRRACWQLQPLRAAPPVPCAWRPAAAGGRCRRSPSPPPPPPPRAPAAAPRRSSRRCAAPRSTRHCARRAPGAPRRAAPPTTPQTHRPSQRYHPPPPLPPPALPPRPSPPGGPSRAASSTNNASQSGAGPHCAPACAATHIALTFTHSACYIQV
jgi:hypothetical protein